MTIKLYSVRNLAQMRNVSIAMIHKHIKRGKLAVEKVGEDRQPIKKTSAFVIYEAEAMRYLAEHRRREGPERLCQRS
jgi:predicted DNA-binding protein YlxM (UPF0122 family)